MTYLLFIDPPLSSAFGTLKKIVTCYMIYNYKNISKLLIFLWEYVLQGMKAATSVLLLLMRFRTIALYNCATIFG
ncbi:MAG: hypothetical protein AMK71_10680 [Nitrospira bacterium SG8_35_4]|nr:MAG: hypothetical protein AMK71_10680 [Nitrospira bacterium SG8_35_4]